MKSNVLLRAAFLAALVCGCSASDDLDHDKLIREGFVALQNVKLPPQSFVNEKVSVILEKMFKDGNACFAECGQLGFGLTTSGLDLQRTCSLELPELSIYDAFAHIAKHLRATMRYDDGRIYLEAEDSNPALLDDDD